MLLLVAVSTSELWQKSISALYAKGATLRVLSTAFQGCEDMLLTATAANVAKATGMIEAGGYDVLLCDLFHSGCNQWVLQ